jgi:RNA polymerase sigma-70 factor (ECF subfamily)
VLRDRIDRIHALCRRLCGNDADAEDATQDALLAVVRGLPGFDHRSAFDTWVHRVTTNVCLDELRRRGRRPTVVARLDAAPSPADAPGATLDLPDRAAPVGDSVAERLDLDLALAELPEEFRVVIVLRDQMGLDYAEIAEVLDIPPGTVRSRIARGRGRLADLLAPAHGSDGNRGTVPDVEGTER